jgi:HEAT repeat protein
MAVKGFKLKLTGILRATTKKYSLLICLSIFCACLLWLLSTNKFAFAQDEEDIQRLAKGLSESTSYRYREKAAKALGNMGPSAASAVPALTKAVLEDDTSFVRENAAEALGKIGSNAKSAEPALIKTVLKDDSVPVRMNAAKALAKIDPESKAAALALIERAHRASEYERYHILAALKDFDKSTLRAIGPDISEEAIRQLVLDSHDDGYIADRAIYVLVHIGPVGVPALIEDLKEGKNERVRRQTVSVLGYIGPDAKAAVPYLIEALNDDTVKDLAAPALGKIGPEAKAAIPHLIEILDGESCARRGAVVALGKIGPAAKTAVPYLIKALKEGENAPNRSGWGTFSCSKGEISAAAARAIGQIGPAAEEAVPALIEALNYKNDKIRLNTKVALENINTIEAQTALKK